MPSAIRRNAISPDLNLRQNRIQPTLVSSPQLVSTESLDSTVEERAEGAADDLDEAIFMRLSRVKEMTGLSKSCLYVLIRENHFPAPVRIGNRAVAWVRSEVRDWALGRIAAPRQTSVT
jgi:prophage regulatory protein